MLVKPISATPDIKRNTVRYSFDTGPSPVDMYVRGSVAWPVGGEPGMVLVAGQDINTKIIYIFEDYSFLTVEPIFVDGLNKEVGASLFFRDAWVKYGCNLFFYNDDEYIYQLYSRQVYRNLILKPLGIGFIKTLYANENVADDTIRHRVVSESIRWSPQSELHQVQGNEESRGRHALRCLITGFEYLPWIDYHKEKELKEYWL